MKGKKYEPFEDPRSIPYNDTPEGQLERLYKILAAIPEDIYEQSEFFSHNPVLDESYYDMYNEEILDIEVEIFHPYPEKYRQKKSDEMKKIVKEFIEDKILQIEINIEEEEKKIRKQKDQDNPPLTDQEYAKITEDNKVMDKIQAEEFEAFEENNKDGYGVTWDYIELEPGEYIIVHLDEYGNPIRNREDQDGWGGEPKRDSDTPWNT